MHMRSAGSERLAPTPSRGRQAARQSVTASAVRHDAWQDYVLWFLLHLAPDAERVSFGYLLYPETHQPGASFFTAPDGSWCEVEPGAPGSSRTVRAGGPRDLWAEIEAAHDLWSRLGRPDWERFGLTVTPDSQWVWLDDPNGSHRWLL